MKIDLNADLGELGIDHDARLLTSVTSASIAAGFHAGDPSTIRATIRLAKEHGVAIGAHPSFNDREGFGRREIDLHDNDIEALVLYQLGAMAALASAEGTRLQHVKPHGALYNMAARNLAVSEAIVRAVVAFDASLILYAPPGSELFKAADDAGLETAIEAFADRAYQRDGTLMSRQAPGSVLDDVEAVISRTIRIVKEHKVTAVNGAELQIKADTICLHSDTPGADVLARRLRAALEAAGIRVEALQKPTGRRPKSSRRS